MTRVTFVQPDGVSRAVEAADGVSLMAVAVANSIEGILADCGGACSCATCHVQVGDAWFETVGKAGTLEESMLEFIDEVTPQSRLACQIKIRPDLEGLTVLVPASQG